MSTQGALDFIHIQAVGAARAALEKRKISWLEMRRIKWVSPLYMEMERSTERRELPPPC